MANARVWPFVRDIHPHRCADGRSADRFRRSRISGHESGCADGEYRPGPQRHALDQRRHLARLAGEPRDPAGPDFVERISVSAQPEVRDRGTRHSELRPVLRRAGADRWARPGVARLDVPASAFHIDRFPDSPRRFADDHGEPVRRRERAVRRRSAGARARHQRDDAPRHSRDHGLDRSRLCGASRLDIPRRLAREHVPRAHLHAGDRARRDRSVSPTSC